jgi:alkylation response protein AidB-like acyl-CoA dehydrogenase
VITGQKVWNTLAHISDRGMLVARTDPNVPKHRGLTYFGLDMHAEGVEVRPLRQITGEAEFNEVFLDEVWVSEDHLVGGLHQGWAVANTTLAHERGTNFPFKEQVVHEVFLERLWAEAATRDRLGDPEVLDGLVDAHVGLTLLRLHNWRTLSALARGREPGPESSWVKLTWTDMTQQLSEVALDVLGEDSPLWGSWQRQYLWSKAASIAGGTSEIQRSIIGERILGLPR